MNILMAVMAILVFVTSTFAGEISETEAKTFLDEWLKTQNTGVFADYANLYATKFQGIKRSGDRTYRYNHATWLRDRKRMFSNKIKVTTDNIQIQTLETGAIMKFEQSWESKGYRDKGAKQLHLIREKDQLRIAHEEMLSSKVLAGKGMILDSTNFPFAYAMEEGIIIPDSAIKVDLKKLTFKTNGVDHIATIPVDAAVLPATTRSLLGMPVRLYGPKGMCESKINGFKIVSKKIPHFGEIQRWKEEKTHRIKIATNIYNEGLQHLVATTEKCSGDFAKDSRLPESPIFIGKKADKENTILARKAFRALPAYKADIKPYIKYGYEESIQVFEISLSGKIVRWISMYVMSGFPYCGQEGGLLGVLWKIDEKGKQLRFVQYLDNDLEYATDLDNDGAPEFLSRDHATRGVPHSFDIIPTDSNKKQDYHFKSSYDYDCPC